MKLKHRIENLEKKKKKKIESYLKAIWSTSEPATLWIIVVNFVGFRGGVFIQCSPV